MASDLTSGVRAAARLARVAEHGVADRVGSQARAADRLARREATELGSRERGEAAAEAADRGADGRGDEDLEHAIVGSRLGGCRARTAARTVRESASSRRNLASPST